MTFTPTPWASQQKSRVATIRIPAVTDKLLDRFERALSSLPPRIVVRISKESSGRGSRKVVAERQESFRADSVIRPMIADNLALGRPWYAGFVRLMTAINPATDKPYRKQLPFERKGLHAMTSDEKMWDHPGEALVVKAVHEAIRQSLGRIREETDGRTAKALSQATKNRWERFREKLRLDLAGAKTAAQVRFTLTDLFSRGGNNSVLRESWQTVLPVIRADWQLSRDLGLLALASYTGKGEADNESDETETAK
jgi:CRISPR-associated protein Cas8a1/Csx13